MILSANRFARLIEGTLGEEEWEKRKWSVVERVCKGWMEFEILKVSRFAVGGIQGINSLVLTCR